MRVLAIDPGPTESGWCIIDTADDCKPLSFGKTENQTLRADVVCHEFDRAVIEMVASYGMPVGAEVFQTVRWIGRFEERIVGRFTCVDLMFRQDVKLNLCKSVKAKDSHITQALVDRFARGQTNHGKGTKANPGWFYGFKADVWAAYALAVTYTDMMEHRT